MRKFKIRPICGNFEIPVFAMRCQRRGGDAWIEEKLVNTLTAAMSDYERLDYKPFHVLAPGW